MSRFNLFRFSPQIDINVFKSRLHEKNGVIFDPIQCEALLFVVWCQRENPFLVLLQAPAVTIELPNRIQGAEIYKGQLYSLIFMHTWLI